MLDKTVVQSPRVSVSGLTTGSLNDSGFTDYIQNDNMSACKQSHFTANYSSSLFIVVTLYGSHECCCISSVVNCLLCECTC